MAQYSAEWVLRQAGSDRTTGSIEFHSSSPVTLYFVAGRVCHGVEGVPVTGLASRPGHAADEALARDHAVELLAVAMGATDGWYYLDPLGHHDDAGPWRWETAALICDARILLRPSAPAAPRLALASVPAPVSLAPVAPSPPTITRPAATRDRHVRLIVPADRGPMTLSAESWRIVCHLASAGDATELRDALGWAAPRIDAALSELTAMGVLASPAPGASGAPAPTPAAPPMATPAPARTVPPNVPPLPGSSAPADPRGVLRRRRSSLKPT